MAAPITHIVLAEKVFNRYFGSHNKSEFLIGTSFPDIRYLGVIDREITHPPTTTIQQCIKKSSFETGMRFHTLVDHVREDFMISQGIYNLFPETKYRTQGLKFFEDQILCSKVSDWQVISEYFNTTLNEERDFGISQEDIDKWHKLLKIYFLQISEENGLTEFSNGIGLSEAAVKEISSINEILKNNQKAQEIVNKFYDDFESLLG